MKNITINLFSLVLLFSIYSCQSDKDTKEVGNSKYYTEKHRPQFHFSPEENWMNDPNGMVYYEDEYHLFYQYYPDSTVWGPMHWGHAISKDLVHWEHLPIALYPDEHGLIFSGSAVVDWNNTSGFGVDGKPPLVAIYSYHSMEIDKAGGDEFQTQGIAYSNDKGRTWKKYEANPVIANPGIRDFRDPKVIWYEDTQEWIMALAALDHLMIYGSKDLKTWKLHSRFGKDIGNHDGVWECPDLFPLRSDTGKEYWVLIQNMGIGNPNGGSGTQYFIGQFDGKEYTVDEKFMELLKRQEAIVPKGKVYQSFDKGYSDWSVEGTAFGDASSTVNGMQVAKSDVNGNEAIGTLTSPVFTIDDKAINFKIGGGNHRGKTYMSLVVDGNTIRQAEGESSDEMKWSGWDVSPYIGKEAQIVITDNYTREWGYISVDEITFAEEVARSEQSGSVWLDAGRDNYAGVTWSDVPSSDGRRIFMGWMSNWDYAQKVPTEKWRSAMTIPWSLSLKHVDGIPRLVGNPVQELDKLANGKWTVFDEQTKVPENGLYELDLDVQDVKSEGFEITLSNDMKEHIIFQYADGVLSLDRTQSGDLSFSPEFTGVHKVNRISNEENLKVRAFVDHSSIEIFIDDGLNVFTDIFFPSTPYTDIEIKGKGTFKMRELKGIWRK